LPLGSRYMIFDLRFILLLQYILCFSLNFDGSITQTDHWDKVGTSAQIHRQKNEAPTIIDTMQRVISERDHRNLSPCRVSCEAILSFVLLALRVCRFHRIFFVGGHLKYLSTSAHPPPRPACFPYAWPWSGVREAIWNPRDSLPGSSRTF